MTSTGVSSVTLSLTSMTLSVGVSAIYISGQQTKEHSESQQISGQLSLHCLHLFSFLSLQNSDAKYPAAGLAYIPQRILSPQLALRPKVSLGLLTVCFFAARRT